MEIFAGRDFDGRVPNRTLPRLGVAVVGPGGLMQRLEFWAGLVSPVQSRAERVVRYHHALRAADRPECFYHRSLAADPLETASLLLDWRDYALDHGWSRRPGRESPGRLGDLARVEACVTAIAPCLAERVTALVPVAHRIAAVIDRIVLAEGLRDWPPPWWRLFDMLAGAGVRIEAAPDEACPGAPAQSDLGRLQRALLEPGASQGPLALSGDGSLRLFKCLDAHGGATALCELLGGRDDHLLLVGADDFVLGAAARARGLPNPGLGEVSTWRPQQQLLPLLLQVAWSPPAADILLQYLTLPTGPLLGLRRALAKGFGDRPGYDRVAWQLDIDDFVVRRLRDAPAPDEQALRRRIADWLPVGAAGGRERMPIALAIDLADRVRDYWRGRLGLAAAEGGADVAELAAAFQVADGLAAGLRDWGEAEIAREPLNRLVEMAARAGACMLGQARQVGGLNVLTAPGAARLAAGAPEHLAWWDPALGGAEAEPPFDAEERAALPAAPDGATRHAATWARWRRVTRPLISATGSALLVVKGGTGDLLRQYLDRLLPAGAWRSLEAELLAGTLPGIPVQPVGDLPLPPAQRWWRTELAIPCPRALESFTGLAALALSPHDYVLRYAARLSSGAIVDLPVDARLLGNLGHRLVQAWFEARPWTGLAPERAAVDLWLESGLDAAILAHALPLAAPGRRAARLAFRETLAAALFQLLRHLEEAGVKEVRVESTLTAALAGLRLEGTLDLLGRLADGRWVVVDLKWGGEAGRVAELAEGRYLQLATYAQLAAAMGEGEIADLVYFILRGGNLLATSDRVFPRARVVAPVDPALSPARVWRRLRQTLSWRCEQLGAGRVEVTYGEAAPTPASEPPEDGLPLLDMEAAARREPSSAGRKPSFKPIDPWRVVTGNIQP